MIQQMFLPLVMRVNTEHDDDHKLNLFPIRGLENMFQYSLVHHKDCTYPVYARLYLDCCQGVRGYVPGLPELVVQADPRNLWTDGLRIKKRTGQGGGGLPQRAGPTRGGFKR
jgi:hypothetical protein